MSVRLPPDLVLHVGESTQLSPPLRPSLAVISRSPERSLPPSSGASKNTNYIGSLGNGGVQPQDTYFLGAHQVISGRGSTYLVYRGPDGCLLMVEQPRFSKGAALHPFLGSKIQVYQGDTLIPAAFAYNEETTTYEVVLKGSRRVVCSVNFPTNQPLTVKWNEIRWTPHPVLPEPYFDRPYDPHAPLTFRLIKEGSKSKVRAFRAPGELEVYLYNHGSTLLGGTLRVGEESFPLHPVPPKLLSDTSPTLCIPRDLRLGNDDVIFIDVKGDSVQLWPDTIEEMDRAMLARGKLPVSLRAYSHSYLKFLIEKSRLSPRLRGELIATLQSKIGNSPLMIEVCHLLRPGKNLNVDDVEELVRALEKNSVQRLKDLYKRVSAGALHLVRDTRGYTSLPSSPYEEGRFIGKGGAILSGALVQAFLSEKKENTADFFNLLVANTAMVGATEWAEKGMLQFFGHSRGVAGLASKVLASTISSVGVGKIIPVAGSENFLTNGLSYGALNCLLETMVGSLLKPYGFWGGMVATLATTATPLIFTHGFESMFFSSTEAIEA